MGVGEFDGQNPPPPSQNFAVAPLGVLSVLSRPFGSFKNFLALQKDAFQLSLITRQYLLRMQMVRKVIALPWRPGGTNCLAKSVSKGDYRFLMFGANRFLRCHPRLQFCKSAQYSPTTPTHSANPRYRTDPSSRFTTQTKSPSQIYGKSA